MTFEADADFGPFFYRPDPEKPRYLPAKCENLVRRGPRSFFLVGVKPDEARVEVRLTSAKFEMRS